LLSRDPCRLHTSRPRLTLPPKSKDLRSSLERYARDSCTYPNHPSAKLAKQTKLLLHSDAKGHPLRNRVTQILPLFESKTFLPHPHTRNSQLSKTTKGHPLRDRVALYLLFLYLPLLALSKSYHSTFLKTVSNKLTLKSQHSLPSSQFSFFFRQVKTNPGYQHTRNHTT
jgi:hypothetical protein